MPRFKPSSAVVIGAVIMAAVWLVYKPANQLPIGVTPPSPVVVRAPVMDNEALEALQASVSGLLQRLEALEAKPSSVSSPVPSFQPETTQAAVKPAFQTQVLYLGSGNTTERDWTETGAQAWLNSASYPSGVNAVFEAGLSIIGGEAWARLKNKTTGAIISVAEVFHNNSTVSWKGSGAFKLHPGNNLYVVEIKSSSGETANLSGSRLQLSQ